MICEFDCIVCGAHVRKRRSPANVKSTPKYCSHKCHGNGIRGTGRGVAPNHICVCQQCGKETAVYRAPTANPPRFCSLACLGASQRADGNPSWTGGRHVGGNGYVFALAPDDIEADSRGYVYEHRLVARDIIGRILLPSEVVHHIDGDTTNNAKENLRVFASQSEHIKHHAELRRANV